MKKQFLRVILTVVITVFMFALSISASAEFSSTDCIGESVEVSTFAELKSALENYSALANVVLKNNITHTDDANSCTINVKGSSAVTIDLNGYQLSVSSKATKYLFNVESQAFVYFVNGKSNRGVIFFNSTQPGAAAVRVRHTYAEIYNLNVDFTMGNLYKSATDSSDTSIFRVERASEMNVFGGTLRNEMTNGNCIYVDETTQNKNNLSFRVGGATLQANKYGVTFNPDYVKFVNFGTGRFESLNSDKGLYERIKVPSTSSITVKDLWFTSAAGTSASINVGGSYYDSYNNKKIASFTKADISVTKTCCDVVSNADDYIVLRSAGGHVKMCGSCKLKVRRVDTHTFEKQIGTAATCTTNGKTSGEKCKECRYSTTKTIPKTGHQNITHVPGRAALCGVDGLKEHYYCADCRTYFADAAGNNKIAESSVVIKNNHQIENKAPVSATCTSTGLTAGIYCHTCKTYKLKQEIIPAKGHDYSGNWVVTRYPTCQQEGVKVNSCKNCTATEEQSISKIAHVDSNDDDKCDVCGKRLTIFDDVTPELPDYPSNPDNDDDNDNNSSSVNCSCGCHAKGIKKFFFKIGLFFQRIFRTNKYCKGCGVAHY